jgi:hypothetical protein
MRSVHVRITEEEFISDYILQNYISELRIVCLAFFDFKVRHR